MVKEKKNISWWIFLFFFSAFLLVSNGRFGGDGLENYLSAESIVIDHDFSIHDRSFTVKEMRCEDRGVIGREGKIYSSYGLGMAFILVPFYFCGHTISGLFQKVPHDYITQFFVSLANPLILALLALVLLRFLEKLGYSPRVSFASVFIYSFCTMNFVYARSGFSEPMVALLVMSAVSQMFSYTKEKRSTSLFFAGLCIGYAIFIKKNSLILLPVFLLYFIYLLVKNKSSDKNIGSFLGPAIAFLVPFILAFIAIALQNWLLYGGASKTEFGTIGNMLGKVTLKSYPLKGLYHYLISPGKGCLIYNIALIFGLFAVKDFFKRYKSFCIFTIFLILSNICYYSFTFIRDSLFSWGPRYLFPTLPLGALFLAEFISKKNTLIRRITIWSAALLGFLIQLPNLFISFSKYLFFVKEKLQLPEFIINYLPELSPIKGSWMLFLSFLNRHLTGNSLYFFYNPDFHFITALKEPLSGYDTADIWWLNIFKVAPGLLFYISITVCFIAMLLLFSYWRIHLYMNAPRRDA